MMSRTSGAWTRSGSARLLLLLLAAALLFAVAHPAAAAPASNRSFVWDRIDVTVLLRPDASFHVIELARVVFGGGPFLEGYREIPLARIERIDHVRVSDVSPGGTTPLRAIAPRQFLPSVPDTFSAEIVGTHERIEWSFSPTTSRARTFLIEYDVYGALRVYDDAEIPYQQISWAGVGRELTRDARVNHASLTFVLPRPVDPDRTVVAGPGSTEPRDHTKDGQTWLWQDSGLAGGESLEATLQFEPLVSAGKPSWQDASDRQELGGASQLNPLLLGLALLVAVGGSIATFAAWWTRGRDPAVGLAPQLLATPPSDLPPGVVGALLDESVDTRDIVATLIDLARRGVLRIEHRAIQGSRGGSRLVVTLLDPYAADAPFEEALLATLFAGRMTPGAWSSLPGEGDRYRAGMSASGTCSAASWSRGASSPRARRAPVPRGRWLVER
jgi:hypothetical protein